MIQELPEVSMNGEWLANKMKDNIRRLSDCNRILFHKCQYF